MFHRAATVALLLGYISASLAGYYPALGYVEESSQDGQLRRSTEGRGTDVKQFVKGYNTGLDEKIKAHQDAGYYNTVDADHWHYGDIEKSGHDSYRGLEGKAEEALNNKADHKKGFSTKGFQDFHHKNEIGKKTTFYDSSDNTGDHFHNKETQGIYGNNAIRGVHKNVHDGKYNEMTRGAKGSYGRDYALEHKNYKSDLNEKKGYVRDDYSNGEYGYKKKYEGVKEPLFYPHLVNTQQGFPKGYDEEPYLQAYPNFLQY